MSDTSAEMEPNTVSGIVVDVEVRFNEQYHAEYLVLHMENSNFGAFERSWKVKRDEKDRIKRGSEVAKMVTIPLERLNERIGDFRDLIGMGLTLEGTVLTYGPFDDGSTFTKDTWQVISVAGSGTTEESGKEEPAETPADDGDDEEDEEEDDEPEEPSSLSDVVLDIINGSQRKMKKDTIVREVVKRGHTDADDNAVAAALKELKAKKAIKEPKLGYYEKMKKQ